MLDSAQISEACGEIIYGLMIASANVIQSAVFYELTASP
jgi:hypothetical protein